MNKDWQPLVGIGFLRFGDSVSDFVRDGVLVKCDTDIRWLYPHPLPIDDVEEYEIPGDKSLKVYVENGCIDDIRCEAEFIYNGVNLIGCTLAELIRAVGGFPDEEVDDQEVLDKEYVIYYFNRLGLGAWFFNEHLDCVFIDDGSD